MDTIGVKTQSHSAFVDITSKVNEIVEASGVHSGVCIVYVPHTTAGITINENADPDVQTDMNAALEKVVPWTAGYRHCEGNAAAHVKASLMGNSSTILIERGRLVLGTWQGIYFCEFDGPRSRKVHIQILDKR